MSGWIKLNRELSHHWVAQEPDALAVWIRILLDANFQDKTKRFNGTLVTINRGQLIFGLNAYSDKTGVSVSKLRRIMNDLEKDGMISRQKTNKYSVITVLAYDLYQSGDSQAASKRQANDSQTATPKEGKKEKKERKLFTPPTKDEAKDYFIQQGSTESESMAFIDYYTSNGWKAGRNPMKDWNASARGWIRRTKPIQPKQEDKGFIEQHTDKAWANGLQIEHKE
jgi:hypothetical protein